MVDNDEATADAVALIHVSLACEVHVAHGGADAVDRASRIQPDAGVMDIAMPFFSGLETGGLLTKLFGPLAHRS